MPTLTLALPARRKPWYARIPLISPIGRELAKGDTETVLSFLVILLTVLVLAIRTWGLVALGLTALACVPVVFVLLIAVTVGK